MATPAHDLPALLGTLGFSPLEATVYAHLLRHGPCSGYRAAQMLGKPVANTYHAIEALIARGAVVADDGSGEDARLCRAVEPGEIFARMQRDFAQRCAQAERALIHQQKPADDQRIYTLRTREQVFERARQMLARCRRTAIIVAFPSALVELRDDIAAAAKRGVACAMVVYDQSAPIAGVEIVLHARAQMARKVIPGETLTLTTDALEHLSALLASDGREVRQALWTRSIFLACSNHDAGMCGVLTQALDNALAGRITFEQLRAFRERMRPIGILESPGFMKMQRKPGAVSGTARRDIKPKRRPAAAISKKGSKR